MKCPFRPKKKTRTLGRSDYGEIAITEEIDHAEFGDCIGPECALYVPAYSACALRVSCSNIPCMLGLKECMRSICPSYLGDYDICALGLREEDKA